MKLLLTILASILTGFGGHLINRRWDRVMLFFVLLVLWLTGAWWFMFWSATQDHIDAGTTVGGGFVPNSNLPLGGAIAIWLLSVLTTAVDAFRKREELQSRWTLSGGIGALGISLLSFVLFGYCGWYAWSVYALTSEGMGSTGERVYDSAMNDYFSEWIYFSHSFDSRKQLPEPPVGEGYLSGRFLYRDAPAVGVTLTVVLNGEYETAQLTTDAQGLFHVRVPPGEWYISMIKAERWSNKPKDVREFLVLTGEEPRVSGANYSRYSVLRDKRGKRVTVNAEPPVEPLTLTIRDHVSVNWPISRGEPVMAEPDDAVIEWQAYHNATQYVVKLSRVERQTLGASYYPVVSRQVTDGTSLALSEFKIASGDGQAQEYQVEVYAFDADNRLLSESRNYSTGSSFTLSGGLQILDETSLKFSGDVESLSLEKVQALNNNRNRLNAAALLIEEGLLDAADTLLQRVQGEYKPGRLEALQGYLAAQRGECKTANEWFDKALGAGGKSCVSARYRDGCIVAD